MNGIIAIRFLNALIIFLVLNLYLAKSTNGEPDPYSDSNEASKRRQIVQITGLMPFPRTGRANQKTWKSRILEQIKRREGLIPFPRVGRSGNPIRVKLPGEMLLAGLNSRYAKDFQHTNPDFEDRWIATILKELNEDVGIVSKFNQNSIDDEMPDFDNARKENLLMQRMNN
ncbi:uncharacterized protein LOC135832079 isoform X2 [Planococcus citri]|uniref:uncharacterized protein LOC135832079 isoform X2 n=1 Tax=Planococcus citri TaxID=170843 RepID=UPI0031F84AC0